MIVSIRKGNSAKGLINYHEKKVDNGVGELIQDSTFSTTRPERIRAFLDIAELNKSVKKDRYTHISISFADTDHVDRETQLKIAERYLQGMGYGEAPRLIYAHHDTTHRHFHIVTSTIDLNGKKIQTFRDHFKNQELSRQIEKDFGLTPTEYFRHEQHKLQEINSKKFSLLKGIEKMLATPDNRASLEKVVGADLIQRISNEQLPNDEIRKILNLRADGEMIFNQLYRIVRQSDAEYKTEKQQLRDRLIYIKSISHSREEFVQRCEQQNIYIRKLAGDFGSATFTYGISEKNFYLAEKRLPLALRHDYLFTGKEIPATFDKEAQRKFLKRIIARCLSQSSSLQDFETRLVKAGVKTEYSSNARGRYGISFQSINIRDAIWVKGSDVGLSWNKLQNYQFANSTAARIPITKTSTVRIPKTFGAALDTSNDDEDKKRKKRDNEQSMD